MTLLDRISPETVPEGRTPVLRTERLVLRAPRPDDAPALVPLINDRRVAENLSRAPHPYARKDAETFISGANLADDEVAFLVTLRDGTLVGACGVGTLAGASPEIGYWFGVAHWGRGYATEAARAVIAYAFDELGHETLEAGARVSNPASRRVLEKCGYEWTGVVLTRVRALGGAAVPCDRFRLDRERWTTQVA
jgi:RimJ/RimL family protein N-acetyltransferase